MPSKSRHLHNPAYLPMIDAVVPPDLTDDTLAAFRDMVFPFGENDPTIDARVQSGSQILPGPTGAPDVPILHYRPKEAIGLLPCIFHVHGGGYVSGSAAMFAAMNRSLVAELGCALVSVDYRLAPEVKFPGAIEDCYAALSWLFGNATAFGVDRDRIGVKGESAGGGLAASLALLARDRGEHRLLFQHLIYPMLDDRTGVTRDDNPYAGEFVWTRPNNRYGWHALLGVEPGSDDVSPYAAAARADRLEGLPPSFVCVSALDLFVEENVAYATRLMRAGVPTELHVFPGCGHGFDFEPNAAVARQARQASVAALRRAFGDAERQVTTTTLHR